MTGVSVIICCYNSASRIVPTLQYLAKQVVAENLPWEVIVVNNASSDNTSSVAEATWAASKGQGKLLIVDQPVAGLSFAREKGIATAKFEYLLFCDDDNWLQPNYIQLGFDLLQQMPLVAALGGHGIPVCELDPPPVWFSKYAGIYATGAQGVQDGELPLNSTLYGACTFYRKSALENLFSKGFNFYLSGRSKDKLTTGEDRELCYALSLIGYKLFYTSSLEFFHFIPKGRLTEEYRNNILIGASNASYALTAYQLLLSNSVSRRPDFKNSWQWIIMMRIKLAFKEIFKEFFSNKLKPENYYWGLKDTVAFYKNRKEYNQLFASLKKQFIK